MIITDIQLAFDWWGVAAKLLPIIFLIAALTILYEIWENKEHDRKLKEHQFAKSIQTIQWFHFRNTTELEDGCWYLFQLRNGGYIVEQYDAELNWRFYVPHTDYVIKYALLSNVIKTQGQSRCSS
jgi:hypothetical protein